MLEKLLDNQFVIFDTETTGLSYQNGDQIIEIAAQKVVKNDLIDSFYALVKNTVPIHPSAASVHGITEEVLSKDGRQANEVFIEFNDFIKDTVLVGHNILRFDLNFVNNHLIQVGQAAVKNLAIDTLVMSRKLLPFLPSHKLTYLAEYFDINPDGAHRADKDVEMNRRVFEKLIELYLENLKPVA